VSLILSSKRILIIEEAGSNENPYDSILTDAGYNTYLAAGEEDGLEIAVHYQPDMIICSTNCFDEGSCIVSTLSKRKETLSIPIVYISRLTDASHLNKMLALGADNYIVAPFDADDFLEIIRRKFEKYSHFKENIIENLNNTMSETENKQDDHILVKIGNKIKLVKFSNISCVIAQKEYSKVITNENYSLIVRKSLRNWLEILPGQNFLRIHRGTIINTEYLDRIEKTNGRTYEVYMKNKKEPLLLSQRYSNIMRRTFPS